jgi:hypothetical protein
MTRHDITHEAVMNSAQARRVIAAGVIGNVLEWYDFAQDAAALFLTHPYFSTWGLPSRHNKPRILGTSIVMRRSVVRWSVARRKMCKRRQIDMGIRHLHLGAGRPIKHPSRNLQPTVRIGTAQAAAKNSVTRPKDQTTDAMGTAVLETRFRGCSQA